MKRSKILTQCTCRNCGKSFLSYLPQCHLKAGRGKCCSRQCSGLQNGLKTSDISKIISMAKSEIRTSFIATTIGCSKTKVRQVLKSNNLMRTKSLPGSYNGMYGRSHSDEARNKIRLANHRQFSNPLNRELAALRTIKQIQNGNTGKAYNNLEKIVANLFDVATIKYIQQYRVGRFLYDFYLPENNILVEVHGTFWHADPRFYGNRKKTQIQQRNIINDERKALRAKQEGYKLIVLWEHDIHSFNVPIRDIVYCSHISA